MFSKFAANDFLAKLEKKNIEKRKVSQNNLTDIICISKLKKKITESNKLILGNILFQKNNCVFLTVIDCEVYTFVT